MRWKFQYTLSALDDLETLELKIAQKIILKIKYLESHDNPLRFARKLKPPLDDLYRFRIGDYRVVCTIGLKKEIHILLILRIKHRKDIYR